MKKLGFWSLFAIVIGGQVGSGIFMLPASLAPYGIFGVFGLIIAAFGALSLAITFAMLSYQYPQTGGPHVYVKEAFGDSMAFFTGWTYWIISWVSSAAVVVAVIAYLAPVLGDHNDTTYVILEIFTLFIVTFINLKGVSSAGRFEIMISIIKFIPLVVLPLVSLSYFDFENFMISLSLEEHNNTTILAKVTLITLWGFVGLEAATTPANSVSNPKRNIPLAVTLGTLFVAVIYLINSVSIMGLIPGDKLQNSGAVYVDAIQYIFGGNWYVPVSLMSSIVCLSTLNAWILTSSQIALGLSEDGLMPKIFSRKNSNKAPYFGLLISGFGTIPLLLLTNEPTFTDQITTIIDLSVVTFLFVYLISVLSFLYIHMKKGTLLNIKNAISFFALLFCSWVIINTEVNTLLKACVFVLSALPLYVFWYKKTY